MNNFFSILNKTFKFCLIAKIPMLIGVIILGSVIYATLISIAPSIKLDSEIDANIQEKISNLAESIDQGDEDQIRKLMSELEMYPNNEMAPTNNPMTASFFTPKLIGDFAILTVVLILILLIGHAYFLVLAVSHNLSISELLNRSIRVFLPLLGVSIWVILRSFIWIPIIGIFTGIYYLPRMAFAGVILVGENKGIFESTKESINRTSNSWFTIAFNYFGLFIILLFVKYLFNFLLIYAGDIRIPVMIIINQIIYGFYIVFTVYLAKSIMNKPLCTKGT